MIYTDIEQGSPEWFAIRCGKVTASKISIVMASGRGNKPSTTRRNYMAELASERLSGIPMIDTFESFDMKRGKELEPFAREAYEFKSGLTVDQIAFADHPFLEMAGCSPDGLIGEDGGLEIKCLNDANHQDLLLGEDTFEEKYIKQVQWCMACTGRKWWDLISYNPNLQEELQLFIIRLQRDSELIKKMETEVIKFNTELKSRVERLRALCESD